MLNAAVTFVPLPVEIGKDFTFEQAFRTIDDVLRKEAGCTTELDYTEQTSWLLFLKYLDGLEQDQADEAALEGKPYTYILQKQSRWKNWAAPKKKAGKIDHIRAMSGDDLVEFVNQKLIPYLHGFKLKATGPNLVNPSTIITNHPSYGSISVISRTMCCDCPRGCQGLMPSRCPSELARRTDERCDIFCAEETAVLGFVANRIHPIIRYPLASDPAR